MKKSDYLRLAEKINEHNRLYYQENAPSISDYAFDQLLSELVEIEKKHPEWVFAGSPTQRVGGAAASGFKVVSHRVPMLSLANTYSVDELLEFIARVERMQGKQLAYTAEAKIDGVAITLLFEEGHFVQALSRGDGQKGEDITQSLCTIATLLKPLRAAPKLLEVRGEIFMPLDVFVEHNREREKSGEVPFANPRNAAGGSLKLLDVKEVARRKLSLFVHGVAALHEALPISHFEALKQLEQWGLPVNPLRVKCRNFEDIMEFAAKIQKQRRELNYEIDGIVVKVDDMRVQQSLGVTGKNYRWAVAYKFQPEQMQTELVDITLQVGRTGVITPVAELKPVQLMGSTIRRATLHNEDEIRRKDIRIGDQVLIEKGGDVIPKVVAVNLAARSAHSHPWKMPNECPVCHTTLQKEAKEVATRCPNKLCAAQSLARLIHFTSRAGMDIDHLGEKVMQQLVERGFVERLSDIYKLNQEQLSQLQHFKEKAIDNLLKSIEVSKKVSLDRFIMALGIFHVGAKIAKLIATKALTIERIMQMNVEELMAIEGVGQIVAESIVSYFADPHNVREVRDLLDAGIDIEQINSKRIAAPAIENKNFVITGTFARFSRDELTVLIIERGGHVRSSVSRATDYLLMGEEPGSKAERAKELNIKILDEEQVVKLLEGDL